MTVFPPCEKCGEKISRRPTDKLCGKCYLQKRKDARDKITKKTGKRQYFEETFWF
jgi:NMD protein affecting ribosome stability and mRNA decay